MGTAVGRPLEAQSPQEARGGGELNGSVCAPDLPLGLRYFSLLWCQGCMVPASCYSFEIQ